MRWQLYAKDFRFTHTGFRPIDLIGIFFSLSPVPSISQDLLCGRDNIVAEVYIE
jgi:hypothetical protein